MTEKKKNAWANMDCEDWGGYMAAKKAKLEEQFQEAAKNEFQNVTSIFTGIAIFVNGYTDPTADELKRLMMAHGGTYHHYTRTGSTTHIIASNLPYSKIVAHKKAQNPLPICKPEWITESIKAGKLLEYRNYLLYSQCTKTQPQIISKLSKTETTIASTSAISNCTKNSDFLSEFYNNSRLHHIATMGATFRDYINELRDKSKGNFPGLDNLIQSKRTNRAGQSSKCDSDEVSNSEDENYTSDVRYKQQVIMHIDMDCFFVSVGLRNRPELKGYPIAVAHAKGNKVNHSENSDNPEDYGSMSEIASCSYEARNAGVKNGMLLGQALKLCPNLKTIRYDFEGYKEVSYTLYDTVASYTLDIEAVSCDEMYADCSQIMKKSGMTPLEFADVIRQEIKTKTGCPVSTGFGANKLQARLATKKAKPDGQYYLNRRHVETYIGTLNARDLPGVGYATSNKLQQMSVNTCKDLQSISLYSLQQELGKKTGEQLYNMCRGIDHSKLNLEHVRKSVSAEVNYGIRFENSAEAKEFLEKLCCEVCERLKKANSRGRCVTLKLMVRAEEAPKEAAKFMGHGLCNNFTKSKNLVTAVDDVAIVTKEILTLWAQLQQQPDEVRGIGIQISRLESTKGKAGESTLLKFIKKMKHSDQTDSDLNDPQEAQITKPLPEILEHEKPSTSKFESPSDLPGSSKSKIQDDSRSSPSVAEVLRVSQENPRKPSNEGDQSKTGSKRLSQSIQMTQDAYFKLTKPNSQKSTKLKAPSLQEIDMNVLIELPEDIRNEILNEYKESNRGQNADKIDVQETKSNQNESPRIDGEISFSQVDPDFLAALPEDMRNDVKMYCEMKKKEKEDTRPKPTVNKPKIASGWNMFKSEKTKAKPSKPKPSRLKIVKTSISRETSKPPLQKAADSRAQDRRKNPDERKKDETLKTSNFARQRDELPKSDLSILNRSLRTENFGVADQDQMLSSLVNCLFNLPLQQIKQHIQAWVSDNISVNEVDFLSLTTYLGMLPGKRRIEDLHVLLKCTHRCIVKSRSCVWHETYGKILEHVQSRMRLEYESDLILPRIECTRCEVSL